MALKYGRKGGEGYRAVMSVISKISLTIDDSSLYQAFLYSIQTQCLEKEDIVEQFHRLFGFSMFQCVCLFVLVQPAQIYKFY